MYFASDHAGYEIKNALIAYARELGCDVEDCGAFVFNKNDDYPDIVANAARKLSIDVLEGRDSRAIVAGASGEGEAMVANRFKGVRCAVYYGQAQRDQVDVDGKKLDILASSREHNDANALSLGLRFLSLDEAKEAMKRWLMLTFSADARHVRRIKKIDELL